MEKRQAVHCRRHIHFNFPDALYKHDIFQKAGRRLAVQTRQLEAVPVQVDRMSVIGLIIEKPDPKTRVNGTAEQI